MIKPGAQQQMVDMVLVGEERRLMVLDAGQADTDRVEERYGQYADGYRQAPDIWKAVGTS